MNNGKKYKYLFKNTILFTISSFGSKILTFFLVPLYTSVLSTAEYGTADLITTTSNLLVFFATICIADAVLRFAIGNIDNQQGIFGFGLRVVLLGSTVIGAILFVLSYFNPLGWDWYLYLFLFLTVLTNGLNQLVSNYLRAIDKIVQVSIMGILVTVITIISNLVLLLIFEIGLIGYLFSIIAGYLFSIIYGLLSILKKDKQIFLKICDNKTRKLMVRYSVPLIFNGVAWWMNNSLDRYFIIYFCGVAVNGLYAAASKIPAILSMVNQIFSQAWDLSAIKEYDKEDRTGFFSNIYGLYNAILTVSCSAIILMNIPLANILFAKSYFEAWEYSSLLVVTAIFAALSGYFGGVFIAVKKTMVSTISTIVATVMNILLNWILIPVYGALGAAIATAVSFFVVWLIRLICIRKYISMRINLFRDFIVYGLIVGQIMLEHTERHMYWGQIVIFVVILFLYKNYIGQIIKKCKEFLKKQR